jgi:hypothetical protein
VKQPTQKEQQMPDKNAVEGDPATWYGLVWRIVRTATESNANTIRASILLFFACVILLLIAHVGT